MTYFPRIIQKLPIGDDWYMHYESLAHCGLSLRRHESRSRAENASLNDYEQKLMDKEIKAEFDEARLVSIWQKVNTKAGITATHYILPHWRSQKSKHNEVA
ncbi:hypothetical protein KW782_02195 [Candidatus Parcubacteria bacterium]|nr:hypothetical protein [Candidatus Parcubacteria bacterium]